jgi:hypothetical protein
MVAALLVGPAEIVGDTVLEGKLCGSSQQVAFLVASGPFQPSGPPGELILNQSLGDFDSLQK